MKALVLLVSVFTSVLCRGQSILVSQPEQRTLICTYRLIYQPDSTTKNTRTEYMRLLIGKNLSKFESEGFFLRDSLIKLNFDLTKPDIAQKYVDQVTALPQSKFRYSIYKAPAQNKLYCYDRVGYTVYTYNEPTDIFYWKVLKGKPNTIAGFVCQKATTTYAGRQYEAWFTREIPISEGPYKFYGLPGLIVRISDTQQHYTFELVKLIRPKQITIISLPTGNIPTTTKKVLRRGQVDYELGMFDRVAAMGNKVTDEEKQVRREKIKSQNNPLELK